MSNSGPRYSHLFTPPPRNPGDSDDAYEDRCFDHDSECLQELLVVTKVIYLNEKALDAGGILFFYRSLSSVPRLASEILLSIRAAQPGPFKKAAALTAALMETPLLLLRDGDADSAVHWKFTASVAVFVVSLYLMQAFSEEEDIGVIDPPRWPSLHFKEDMLDHLIRCGTGREDITGIGLLWELLTYNENPMKSIPRRIDRECPGPTKTNLTGLDEGFLDEGFGDPYGPMN